MPICMHAYLHVAVMQDDIIIVPNIGCEIMGEDGFVCIPVVMMQDDRV